MFLDSEVVVSFLNENRVYHRGGRSRWLPRATTVDIKVQTSRLITRNTLNGS